MNSAATAFNVAVASSFPLGKIDADGNLVVQVMPDGDFGPNDGRPMDVPAWRMNAANAQRVIAAHAKRKTPLVIDYDHQTLYKEKNGQPALAAAWFQSFEYRPGEGLFATVKPTARASQLIAGDELKFFSPFFAYDRNGNVLEVLHGGFTNTPAIDGMAAVELAAAASSQFLAPNQPPEIPAMKTLLAALCAVLGLADNASADDVTNAVTQLKKDKDDTDTKLAAASAQLGKEKDAAPDPSKFVPIESFNDLQKQVAALSQQQTDQAVADLVAQGEEENKLTAATSTWFRAFAAKDLDGAKAWLKDAPVIAALSQMQSGGKNRAPAKEDEITDPVAVAALARKYQDEQRAAGVEISTAAAVAHVTKKKDA
ncbi:MAG: protease [Pseudoxanthomonas spadix]|nr:MAG: protease [Pseudoxanthomonas spadix]